MPYQIAGIDGHKKTLAVAVAEYGWDRTRRDDLLDPSRARARHDPLTPKLSARSGRLSRRITTIVQQRILDWRGTVQGLASVVLYYSSRIPTVPSSSPVLVRSTA